ncbi:hypothetical protein ABIA35_002770 [Catenulispora sp. MAP12-49]
MSRQRGEPCPILRRVCAVGGDRGRVHELSGGAHIGPYGGPLLLADGANIPPAEVTWLQGHSAFFNTIDVFGGTKVVPQAAVTQAANTAWGAGNWS